MSRMGDFILELQEFVYPLVYRGLSNEQIKEQWNTAYKGTDYYNMGLMYLSGTIKTAHTKMYGREDFDEAINREL